MSRKIEGGTEELTALLATLAKVNHIDLGKIAEAAEKAKTVQEKFIEELAKGNPVSRKKPKRVSGSKHWKRRTKYLREYNKNVRRPRRAVARADLLREGGWFPLLELGWRKAGIAVEVTQTEWEEAVGALLDYVPVVGRYDTSGPIRLDNVVVRDRDSTKVLFDGKEWDMRNRGYIL